MEVRAQDLMSESFIDFLAEKGLAFVVVDREGTPDLFEIWLEHVQRDNAPDFAYVPLDRRRPQQAARQSRTAYPRAMSD